MKKYCCFIVLCLVLVMPSTLMAQQVKDFMRYEYMLTYKPFDKKITPNAEPLIEKFYLDVDGSRSLFISEGTYLEFVADLKEEESGTIESKIPWFLSRDAGDTVLYEMINMLDAYKVKQPVNTIKWTISNETENFHNMRVQKAIGELSGRTWTVWFTTEIPLIEGPYKFKNLPGFVVKAKDADQDYVFEFIESKKVNNYWFELSELDFFKEVTDKQLKRLKNLNANKSYMQIIQETGGKLLNDSKEPSEFMTKKFGKEPNPIEFY
ncbi:GLPGLI family protein [Myroides marinus]|uniref:GLPGLI family protein n=1 Tax=Myroides marinus TaxID=703342 RepID=A0A1H6YD45_9FLAO|nr:GLPGLI family protein [Myroides marinus]SEJ34665.1 GLPGLI family protein [Myroides marinus]